MILGYIIKSIIGVLICEFICGGWYLIGEWIDDISFRRWEKKMDKQLEQKEESK